MKICYVAPDVAVPHYRGSYTHVYELSKNLIKLGHEVHLICRRVYLNQSKSETVDGINIHRIDRGIFAPIPLSSYRNLESNSKNGSNLISKFYESYLFTFYAFYTAAIIFNIVRKYRIDIILERETSFGSGAFASRITNRPMVLEIIGPRYSKYSIKTAKKILIYTETMLHDKIEREKLQFVKAAVNTDLFKPDPAGRLRIRKKYGMKDSPVLGYIGTFASWHGLDDLINITPKILEKFPKSRFLMVGPYSNDLKRIVEKKGIEKPFIFTGPVKYSEISNYINAADVLLAPYNPNKSPLRKAYGIGSPLKIFEYMACGKPVVSTFVEPINEVVEDKNTGLLVPPGDCTALFNAINCLLEKPDFASKIGETANKKVRNHYSWAIFAKNLEQLMIRLLTLN